MRETRKQKVARQRRAAQERAADRMLEPIRRAIEAGDLVIGPAPQEVSPWSGLEFCPRCGSGPRQRDDGDECPDCGRKWAGPRLLDSK
jgi:hypothetical protein